MSAAKDKGFVGSVLTLMSGNILAQAVTVGCTPILTRLFPPEAYGEFALAFSCITVLASISHLRYNSPIMLPKDEEDSHALTLLALCLVAGFSALALAVVLLLPETLRELLGVASPTTLKLIPLGCLFSGGILVLQIRNLRLKQFRRQAAAQFAGAATSRTLVILAGLSGLTAPVVLVAMKPLNDLFLLVTLVGGDFRSFLRQVFGAPTWKRVPAVARAYSGFPKYCGTDLVLMLNMELPTFLLAFYYDPVKVGLYNLAVRMLKQPSMVIGQAIGRSFFQHTADQLNKGRPIGKFVLRVLEFNLILYLFPAVILWAFAPELFGLVFGGEWQESGSYVRILLPVFLLTFISLFTGTLLDTLGLQRERFLFSLLQLAVSLAAFALGAARGGASTALIFLSVGSSLVLAARIFWVTGKAGVAPGDLLRRTLAPLAAASVLGAIFFGARPLLDGLAGNLDRHWLELPLAALLLAAYFAFFYLTRIRRLLAERGQA
jgi:O-antigen/teichoic acid export membrane protein